MKKFTKILLLIIFTSITLFGFAVPLNIFFSNWYNQYLPNLNNKTIKDITFVDSQFGFSVTTGEGGTCNILKTTNGGDNWFKLDSINGAIYRVIFINANTGFISGGNIQGGFVYKTNNSGVNWSLIPASVFAVHFIDMCVLNQDTVFVVDDNGFNGGVYRTTNGGNDWEHLFGSPSILPQKIYMYNGNMGFFSTGDIFGYLYKTTNGGYNWTNIGNEVGFSQISFMDSVTGWKASSPNMKKTTNGGLNWTNQPLPTPSVGYISGGMYHFSVLNKDTIWGVGSSYYYPNLSCRGVIYRTTNGGNNWLYQIPDTTIITMQGYAFIQFINKYIGWSYLWNRGIHTIKGGDTTFLSVHQIGNEVPKGYKLFQNYPNPFNSMTNVKVQMLKRGFAEIKVFNITGKLIKIFLNKNLNSGEYQTQFDGEALSSGVYFYSLFVNGIEIDTKKMLLIK